MYSTRVLMSNADTAEIIFSTAWSLSLPSPFPRRTSRGSGLWLDVGKTKTLFRSECYYARTQLATCCVGGSQRERRGRWGEGGWTTKKKSSKSNEFLSWFLQHILQASAEIWQSQKPAVLTCCHVNVGRKKIQYVAWLSFFFFFFFLTSKQNL